METKQQLHLRRVLARWKRYNLIAIDEVGYLPMADLGAEVTGYSPQLDLVAGICAARREECGRCFIDERGAFFKPPGSEEIQFVAWGYRWREVASEHNSGTHWRGSW
jgi:hypothetical protein